MKNYSSSPDMIGRQWDDLSERVNARSTHTIDRKVAFENKIVIEVAGTGLETCCHETIGVHQLKDHRGILVDAHKVKRISNSGRDQHRYEVEIAGLPKNPRDVYLSVGCCQAYDATYRIPLQYNAQPTDRGYKTEQWPTVLIPLIPFYYSDVEKNRRLAKPMRSGWLYIYINGYLWREIYAAGDDTFRDVNFELPHIPQKDVREPSGHLLACVLVPYKINDQIQNVEVAFAEVQWPWRTICAMGGPAPNDPRFQNKVIAHAQTVAKDNAKRRKRFVRLDFSAYPNKLASMDGIIGDIVNAPTSSPSNNGHHSLLRLRNKRIAALYLEDALFIARQLAFDHQQAWRDMEMLLHRLAATPRTDLKERTYPPARWFDSALLANHYFFGSFPDFKTWQAIHPRASNKFWELIRQQHQEWQNRIDKESVDQALGTDQRITLRRNIDQAKQRLIDYMTVQTANADSLLMLMIDDYFELPYLTGRDSGSLFNASGYVNGWGVVEQLLARLGDHAYSLDAVLEAVPPDTERLTRSEPGIAYLNDLADPDKGNPLHARLFPKKLPDKPLLPDEHNRNDGTPLFKPHRFHGLKWADGACVIDFLTLFTKAGLMPEAGRKTRQSVISLANAVFNWQLTLCPVNLKTVLTPNRRLALPAKQVRELHLGAIQGRLTPDALWLLLRQWRLFAVPQIESTSPTAAHRLCEEQANLVNTDSNDTADNPATCIRFETKESLTTYPKGMTGFLKVCEHNGHEICKTSIEQFQRGDLGIDQWPDQQGLSDLPEDCRIELITTDIHNDSDLFRQFLSEPESASNAIIPLAVLLELWNVSDSIDLMVNTIACDKQKGVITDFTKVVQYYSSMVFAAIYANQKRLFPDEQPQRERIFRKEKNAPGRQRKLPPVHPITGLGRCAGSGGLWPSIRDMSLKIQKSHDNPAKQPLLSSNLRTVAALATPAAALFFKIADENGTCNGNQTSHFQPYHDMAFLLEKFAFQAVLAESALLMSVFKEREPIENWLTFGPFSYQPYNLPVVQSHEKHLADALGALVVDERNQLLEIVADARCRLLQADKDIFLVGEDGTPVKKIASIGEPVRDNGRFKDPACRFAGHRPGDIDLGVPKGGRQKRKRYPGTTRVMSYWQEPNGSFLWIDQNNRLFDYKLMRGGRLYEKNHLVFLKTPEGDMSVGKMGGPLENPELLSVDRKHRDDQYRRWCEVPESAYHALCREIFKPQVQLAFSCMPCKGVKLPDADPFTRYTYFAVILITVPYFIPAATQLTVQLWEQYDVKPMLTYDDRIMVITHPNSGTRQFVVTWPLAAVYSRHTKVKAKVRLDIFGDDSLTLPLTDFGMKSDLLNRWSIAERRIDKFSLRNK